MPRIRRGVERAAERVFRLGRQRPFYTPSAAAILARAGDRLQQPRRAGKRLAAPQHAPRRRDRCVPVLPEALPAPQRYRHGLFHVPQGRVGAGVGSGGKEIRGDRADGIVALPWEGPALAEQRPRRPLGPLFALHARQHVAVPRVQGRQCHVPVVTPVGRRQEGRDIAAVEFPPPGPQVLVQHARRDVQDGASLERLCGAQLFDDLREPARRDLRVVRADEPRHLHAVALVGGVEPKPREEAEPEHYGEAVPALVAVDLAAPFYVALPHQDVLGRPEDVARAGGQAAAHYVGRARRGAAVADPRLEVLPCALRVPSQYLSDLLVAHAGHPDLLRRLSVDSGLVAYGYQVPRVLFGPQPVPDANLALQVALVDDDDRPCAAGAPPARSDDGLRGRRAGGVHDAGGEVAGARGL